MRQVVKINTAVFLRDISKWNMVLGILLLITQFVLGIAFIQQLTIECAGGAVSTCDNGIVTGYNQHGLSNEVQPTFIGLAFCFVTLQSVLFVVLYILCKDLVVLMIYFHDYLIAYKQTPRSRMFKRYKPPMDQIMECDSVDEQTQASMSIVMSQRHSALQSLGGSIHSNN